MLQLQPTWTCSKKLSAPGKWTGDDYIKGYRPSRSYLEAQDFITAVSSEHVPVIKGKLDDSDVKIMVDSGSSVSLVDKAYLPSGCVILRRQQALRTADGHGMRIVGMVRLTVHLGAFKAEQEIVYIDYILITGSTDKEHLETLEKVLYKLKEAGIHLNKDKCFFLQESVVYLGYKIDKNGIHPLAEKVEAVKNAPEPKNITELKSYLGLLTYYSRFLPRMATMLAQLYRLLQAKIPWNWTQKEKMAFENSKNLLLSAKVLVHFDPNKELILACDASSYGVGAVLSHKMPDGTERPIAFASRTLSSAEKNYSQLEKEGLACIFGVKRFHLYLYGRNFTIVTDHKPLLQLFDPQRGIPMQVSGRIQRWIMTLAVYKYKLVFKKTEEHGNADALSRLPMDGKQIEKEEEIPTELVLLFESLKDSPVDCSQVKHWTKKDPILSQVLQYILAGWPLHPPSGASQTLLSFWQRRMELSTHDGCILWGNRVVVPEKGRNYVLQELHGGHPGISRMRSLSRTFVWWPGIDKDIEMLVSKCPQCQAARPSPPVAPLQPWSWPTRPWARLHIDYAGPVEGQMLLVGD